MNLSFEEANFLLEQLRKSTPTNGQDYIIWQALIGKLHEHMTQLSFSALMGFQFQTLFTKQSP